MSRQETISTLVDIDIALGTLLLKSKNHMFTYLTEDIDTKQLLAIDTELSDFCILKLDTMSAGEERKSRIIKIQKAQKAIDIVIRHNSKENSNQTSDLKFKLEETTMQLESAIYLLKSNMLELDNCKTKMELLVCDNDRLKNQNEDMADGIVSMRSSIREKNLQAEKISDLLRTEQAKNVKMNEALLKKNLEIEELKKKKEPVGSVASSTSPQFDFGVKLPQYNIPTGFTPIPRTSAVPKAYNY